MLFTLQQKARDQTLLSITVTILMHRSTQNNQGDKTARSRSRGTVSIDLQMTLLNTWSKQQVGEYYQAIFLAYLDQLPNTQIESKIKSEIRQTLQRKTPFFKLQDLHYQRQRVLQILQGLVRTMGSFSTEDLQKICNQLYTLRDLNLQVAQYVLKMYNLYHCHRPDGSARQMQHYDRILNEMHKDSHFLRVSKLSRIISFSSGYDPFFLHHYEKFHRDSRVQPKALKELFNINISYAYRLMKVRNMIMEMRSLAKMNTIESEEVDEVGKGSLESNYYPKVESGNTAQDELDDSVLTEVDRKPVKISPIRIYPSKKEKKSMYLKGVYPSPKEKYLNPSQDSRTQFRKNSSVGVKTPKKSHILWTQPDEHYMHKSDRNPQSKKLSLQSHGRLVDLDSFKPALMQSTPESLPKINENRTKFYSDPRQKTEQIEKPYQSIEDYDPIQERIYHYNPIKKSEYLRTKQRPSYLRYSFNPDIAKKRHSLRTKDAGKISHFNITKQEEGLESQMPIGKFNQPRDNSQLKQRQKEPIVDQDEADPILSQGKKRNPRNKKSLASQQAAVQIKGQSSGAIPTLNSNNITVTKPAVTTPTLSSSAIPHNAKHNAVASVDAPPSKVVVSQAPITPRGSSKPTLGTIPEVNSSVPSPSYKPVQPTESQAPPPLALSSKHSSIQRVDPNPDDTLQNGLFEVSSDPLKPKFKELDASSMPLDISSINPPRSDVSSISNKKAIKMRTGKLSLPEVMTLLKSGGFPNEYQQVFEMQKLQGWVQTSQTYVIEFLVNEKLGAVGLCSPIPSIGMALKFWSPIPSIVDAKLSSTLFKKMVEYVDKMTTDPKMMYTGAFFEELKAGEFILKKQKLYERARKVPARKIEAQFKPFLYVECSNLRYPQIGTQPALFSQEIESFSDNNCYLTPSFNNMNVGSLPESIQVITKINRQLNGFQQVNAILTKQDFDSYEVSQLKASHIDLLRFYLNCPFKSTFIAHDGSFKFTGSLHHENANQCLVSVGTLMSNGTVFFGKGMNMDGFVERTKTPSIMRTPFSVKMFNKKLYGRIPHRNSGHYGNWQISLTWQDQMQGRLRHNMNQPRSFGPQPFFVGIMLEKELLYACQVGQDDYIY